jgi:hypothetical protein
MSERRLSSAFERRNICRAFFAVYWLLRATRQMIDHFRAGENLTSWYLREIQTLFLSLQRLRVVSSDEVDSKG